MYRKKFFYEFEVRIHVCSGIKDSFQIYDWVNIALLRKILRCQRGRYMERKAASLTEKFLSKAAQTKQLITDAAKQ